MTWLTWRQHRIEILIMGIILLLFAVVFLITGIHIAGDAQRFSACMSHQQADCSQSQVTLENDVNQIPENPFFPVLLLALPLLAGMFIGAYAIAREFEQGTYRMIWTQGLPWYRWLLDKISLLAGVVLCAFGILFGLLSWWAFSSNVFQVSGTLNFANRFDIWGVVTVAYALFAFMLGICVSTITRKTVPAMAITLVLFIVVRILITNFWRPYYLPPKVLTASLIMTNIPVASSQQVPANSWIISDTTIDRQGQPVSMDAIMTCQELLGSKGTDAAMAQYNSCINAHGYQNRFVYQPPDRFWLFQAIESGIYLLLAALLFAFTFWWTKRRIIRA